MLPLKKADIHDEIRQQFIYYSKVYTSGIYFIELKRRLLWKEYQQRHKK